MLNGQQWSAKFGHDDNFNTSMDQQTEESTWYKCIMLLRHLKHCIFIFWLEIGFLDILNFMIKVIFDHSIYCQCIPIFPMTKKLEIRGTLADTSFR